MENESSTFRPVSSENAPKKKKKKRKLTPDQRVDQQIKAMMNKAGIAPSRDNEPSDLPDNSYAARMKRLEEASSAITFNNANLDQRNQAEWNKGAGGKVDNQERPEVQKHIPKEESVS